MSIDELITNMRQEIADNEQLCHVHYLAIGLGAFDKLPLEDHSRHMADCGKSRKRIAELKRTIDIIGEFNQ